MKSSKGTKPVRKTKEEKETLPTVLEEYIDDLTKIAKDYIFLGNGVFDLKKEHKDKLPYFSKIVIGIKDDAILCTLTGNNQKMISTYINFTIMLDSISQTDYFFQR